MVSARICSTNKFRFFPTAGILSTRDSVKSIVLTMMQVKLSLIVASPPLSHLSSIHVPWSPSTNINYRKKKRQKRWFIDYIVLCENDTQSKFRFGCERKCKNDFSLQKIDFWIFIDLLSFLPFDFNSNLLHCKINWMHFYNFIWFLWSILVCIWFAIY